jgi:ABC transporter with metal-binding/Fe-S-binding domain ATP-binding protein
MNVGVLFSGGKDSTYAAYLAKRTDQLKCLVTLKPSTEMSYMFHYPNIQWTKLQALSIGIEQIMRKTKGIKELELMDLKKAIALAQRRFNLEGIYTGALASVYQKSRVDRICTELGLESISPLWMADQIRHLRNLLKEKFRVMVTGVSALGLGDNWLGRIIDESAIHELKELQRRYGLNPGFEGGEAETFVLDCPMFQERIDITLSLKHWKGEAGYLEIKDAKLVPKQ